VRSLLRGKLCYRGVARMPLVCCHLIAVTLMFVQSVHIITSLIGCFSKNDQWSICLTFGCLRGNPRIPKITCFDYVLSSSSSLARQPYVGPGVPQKLPPAKVSGYCFFRFRDKSLFQGGVVSPTPNPRLSWRADVFCQGCLP
jgi:hypothetical protein